MESGLSADETGSEWPQGWPVVLAGAIGVGTGPGLFQNLSSLFTPGMAAEFGWSRGTIATAAGLGLIGGLAAPVLGRVTDRVGVRAMVAGATVLLALAYAGLATMSGSLWQYRLLVLALALTVPGTGSLAYGKLIAARFRRRRGLALAAATSGLSFSTLLLPPVLASIIALYGWRGGFVALAMLVVGFALPLVILLTAPDAGVLAAREPAIVHDGMSAAAARRTGRFWALGCAALLVNAGTVGLVTQLVPFGIDRGLSPAHAAWLLTSYGASQIVGRFGSGWLVDRVSAPVTAAAAAALSAAAFAGLLLPSPGLPLAVVLVFGAGLMSGADFDLIPWFAARLFGLRNYGEVYGSMLVLSLLGTGTGIVAFGRLHDRFGGYGVALSLACAALLVAAVLFLSLARAAAPKG